MKITKTQLKQIIKEELDTMVNEAVTPDRLVKTMFYANNELVRIMKMIDDPQVKQQLNDLRIMVSDTAAAYDGSGTSDPTQEYTGGRGGH